MVPAQPKIYHIVHVDRLASILASQGLLCGVSDGECVTQRAKWQLFVIPNNC